MDVLILGISISNTILLLLISFLLIKREEKAYPHITPPMHKEKATIEDSVTYLTENDEVILYDKVTM